MNAQVAIGSERIVLNPFAGAAIYTDHVRLAQKSLERADRHSHGQARADPEILSTDTNASCDVVGGARVLLEGDVKA
jgi:hypothetical protein